jgi:queuine/archaeosine tRNA-ribosyltransferase
MPQKIPKLSSRYIPVHNKTYAINDGIHWWRSDSYFNYPNVLINLIGTSKEEIEKLRGDSKDLFLLTDSGGFQVISGKCDLTWETSLLKQIELGASKIFAFDKPPVKPLFEGSLNQFIYMSDEETKRIIEENIKVALIQSEYLKKNYPEDFKRFCYIVHGKSKEQIEYNLILFDKYLGGRDNYSKFFPGGIVYASKSKDILFITIAARHAYENFIKKGIYVHFLGLGSFSRILILIRNKITTFDSSSVLQGARANDFVNPLDITNSLQILTDDFCFEKSFCTCPVCSSVNYNELIEKNIPIGRYFIAHNLWHLLKINVMLDSIPLNKYTEIVSKLYKVRDVVKIALDFCDCADQYGFEVAYEKYKHHLKKDETKQKTLF